MKTNIAPATNSSNKPVNGMTSMELKTPVRFDRNDVTSHILPLKLGGHKQTSSCPRGSSVQIPSFWQGQICGAGFGGSSAVIENYLCNFLIIKKKNIYLYLHHKSFHSHLVEHEYDLDMHNIHLRVPINIDVNIQPIGTCFLWWSYIFVDGKL